MEETIWITHTCRVCGRAFQAIDNLDTENFPPTYRACEACVSDGYEYEDRKKAKENVKRDQLYNYVAEKTPNHLQKHTSFILNKSLEIFERECDQGKRFNSKSIFSQAIEVLENYLEDEDYSFKNIQLSKI